MLHFAIQTFAGITGEALYILSAISITTKGLANYLRKPEDRDVGRRFSTHENSISILPVLFSTHQVSGENA
jgi:hypothetical protein